MGGAHTCYGNATLSSWWWNLQASSFNGRVILVGSTSFISSGHYMFNMHFRLKPIRFSTHFLQKHDQNPARLMLRLKSIPVSIAIHVLVFWPGRCYAHKPTQHQTATITANTKGNRQAAQHDLLEGSPGDSVRVGDMQRT